MRGERGQRLKEEGEKDSAGGKNYAKTFTVNAMKNLR